MVTKIIQSIAQPISGLHKAAYILAVLSLGSQILALLRDRLFAHTFGAGDILDMYYASFKIPDLLFAGIITLISAYVLVPRIVTLSQEGIQKLMSHTMLFLTGVYALVCIPLLVMLPDILNAVFPKLYAAFGDEFVMFSAILLFQPLFLGLSNIFGSVTQSKERFVLFALSPVVYNLGIIFGLLTLYPVWGLMGVAVGVTLGSFFHLLINFFVLHEERTLPKITAPDWELLKAVIYDSFPRSLSMIAIAITAVALASLASVSGEGLVAVFTLAGNIQAIPLSLIAVSYATAAFPLLSRQWGQGEVARFQATFLTAARHLIFWSVIIGGIFIVLRAHIVRVILGTGEFDWGDTRLTAAVLSLLVLALFVQGFVLLSARAWYAAKRNWMPSIIQCIGAAVTISLSFIFIAVAKQHPIVLSVVETLFRIENVEGSLVVMIALAVLCGHVVMALATVISMRDIIPHIGRELARPLLHSACASVLGGGAAYMTLTLMGNIAPLSTLFLVLAQGVIAGMVGSIVALLVLVALDNQEIKSVYKALTKRTKVDLPTIAPSEQTGE
jgi:putative peptidoglycan lipid II flippase